MKHLLVAGAAIGLLSCGPALPKGGSPSAPQKAPPAEARATAIVGPRFATSIHATHVQVKSSVPLPSAQDAAQDTIEFNFELEDRTLVSCAATSAQTPAAVALKRRLDAALGSSKVSEWVTSGPWVVQGGPLFLLTAKLALSPSEPGSAAATGAAPAGLEVNGSSAVVGGHLLQCTRQGAAGPLFERAMRELVACYRSSTVATPTEREVIALRFDALPVGYSLTTTETLSKNAGQEPRRVRTLTAQWLPRSPTELLIADEIQEEVEQAGQLIETHEAHFDDEGAGLDVTLRAKGDGTYSVRGRVDGKPLEGTLQAPEGLPSERALQARVHALLESHQGFDIQSPSYLPALDPLAVVPIRYFQTNPRQSHEYQSQLGAVVGTHLLGDDGQQIRQTLAIGSSSLIAERVHHEVWASSRTRESGTSSERDAKGCLE